MGTVRNMIAGLAGAVALNVLHEVARKNFTDVPRINLLGEEALNKTLGGFGIPITNRSKLRTATLEADIVSNAIYYSFIGSNNKHVWFKAVALGLSAGVAALKLPEPLGLDPTPVTRTTQTKVLTVGYYMFGALVTAFVLKKINNKF